VRSFPRAGRGLGQAPAGRRGRETAEIELSNSSHEPRARVRIFPCGSRTAVQCLDEEGATSNGNGAGDEAHNEARNGASSSEKRVERLRAYLGTLVEATNDAVIGFDEDTPHQWARPVAGG
jgi:hypothetical protein